MKNILKGIGVDDLKFGLYTTDVEENLGDPSEVEQDESGEDWHYDDHDLSMSFDEDQRLVTIAVSSDGYLLEGVTLIGKDIEFVEEQVKNMGLGKSNMEDVSDELESGLVLLSYEESSMNFWFDGGVLTEIQFWPLFENEDTIIWPS